MQCDSLNNASAMNSLCYIYTTYTATKIVDSEESYMTDFEFQAGISFLPVSPVSSASFAKSKSSALIFTKVTGL